MATWKHCDICDAKIVGEPEVINVNGNELEVCELHKELWDFVWGDPENIIAMFDSVKRRKNYKSEE